MKSEFDNWSDIRVFLAVMRQGSTLAASRALGLAQPTVARRIDALEHALGFQLFERDTRGFHPTEHARALLPAAEEAEAAMARLTRLAETRHRASAEVIRVTAAGPFIEELLRRPFRDFAERHPNVRFDYFASGDLVDIEAGEADIALRATHDPQGRETLCRRLPDYHHAIFCTPEYAERYGLPDGLDALSAHAHVGYTGPITLSAAYRFVVEQRGDAPVVAQVNNQAAAIGAISEGTAVGMLTHMVARRHPDLVRCFTPPAEMAGRLWLLVSPAAKERRVVRRLVERTFDKIADRVRQADTWPTA